VGILPSAFIRITSLWKKKVVIIKSITKPSTNQNKNEIVVINRVRATPSNNMGELVHNPKKVS
jgi:hypothetical protein